MTEAVQDVGVCSGTHNSEAKARAALLTSSAERCVTAAGLITALLHLLIHMHTGMLQCGFSLRSPVHAYAGRSIC